MADNTDFVPGDEPVPVESVVEYFGSQTHGRYTIIAHTDRTTHPPFPGLSPTPEELAAAYPDGVAYVLWPEGVERSLWNQGYGVSYVRRTSFRVISRPTEK